MEAQEKVMTTEEIQQMRAEVAAELEMEDSGKVDLPQDSKTVHAEHKKDTDPWAGVNPALKIMFDNMQASVAEMEETKGRLKQTESRIGAITNELYAAKKAAAEMAAAPSKAQMEEAARSDEDWEQLKSEFPEWASATDKRMDAKMNAKIAKLREEFAGNTPNSAAIQEKIVQLEAVMKDATPVEIQKGIVSFFHPDWLQTIATPEYNAWLMSQPAEIQAKIKSDKAVDAVSVLDAYKGSKDEKRTAAEIAADRRKRMRTAVNLPGGKPIPIKSEADMTETELRAAISAEVFSD